MFARKIRVYHPLHNANRIQNIALEDDDGFLFTRVRNIPPPTHSPSRDIITAKPISKKARYIDESVIGKQKTAELQLNTAYSLSALKLTSTNQSPQTKKPQFNSFAEDSQTTIISLPLTDTPIIRRNQQLRQHAPNGRRSSLGMRGKRASSLSGGLVAVPHSDISSNEFYKHLDSDLPDPHRMKQLLTWCAQRTIEREKNKKSMGTASKIAQVIEEEILKDLTEGRISTSWWSRLEDEEEPKLPNPQNIANKEKLSEFSKRLERLKAEKKSWSSIRSETRPELPPSLNIDVSFLLPKEVLFLSKYSSESKDNINSCEEVKKSVLVLEPQLDNLRHAVNEIKMLSKVADNYFSKVLRDVSSSISFKENITKSISGTDAVSMRDVLQTLTKVDRL
ncbi:Mis12-Mtw1 protein family-domain-containing protein [Dipodascopsis uninucleata]